MSNNKYKYLHINNCGEDIYIHPCPICGKIPKVKIDYSSEESFLGGDVTIRCKSFFGNTHFSVRQTKASNKSALRIATNIWNGWAERHDKADFYEEEI